MGSIQNWAEMARTRKRAASVKPICVWKREWAPWARGEGDEDEEVLLLVLSVVDELVVLLAEVSVPLAVPLVPVVAVLLMLAELLQRCEKQGGHCERYMYVTLRKQICTYIHTFVELNE